MSKLGEKIREIRLKEGLSQEEFAKELGYNSRSTINKIEKGINEISYDKLMLLINKYELEIDELFDRNYKQSFEPVTDSSNLYVSFSARKNGNCSSIANYLKGENDKLIFFKDIFYNPCSKCNYECFKTACKYRHDDIYELFNSTKKYKNLIFLVPMYCGNPSSLYFIFCERMHDFFCQNEEYWEDFKEKNYFICLYGSDKETPYFIDHFKGLVKYDSQILKIERHNYNIKMTDFVLENKKIKEKVEKFKDKLM